MEKQIHIPLFRLPLICLPQTTTITIQDPISTTLPINANNQVFLGVKDGRIVHSVSLPVLHTTEIAETLPSPSLFPMLISGYHKYTLSAKEREWAALSGMRTLVLPTRQN